MVLFTSTTTIMSDSDSEQKELIQKIKEVMVEELMLQYGAEEIPDDVALFDPAGVGLDSVDALQLVVGLEKNFGLKIPDADAAKDILKDVNSIAAAIQAAR